MVKLSEMGISDICCRRTITSGVVFEISGKEDITRADAFATRLKEEMM